MAALALVAFFQAADSRAQLNLNWEPATASPAFPRTFVFEGEEVIDTVIHDDVNAGETFVIPNQTPFIYEKVMDGGVPYYHMVVGDPETGFAQEVYIQAGPAPATSITGGACSGPVNCEEGTATFTIGAVFPEERDFSASAGQGSENDPTIGNGFFPLDPAPSQSGNMTANPTRVVMQQRVVDGDLTMDFRKDVLTEKPSISNVIDIENEFRGEFNMNSAGILYTDNTTPSEVTNTVQHLGANAPPDVRPPGGGPSSASFDMSTDADVSVVTAGRYTYTPGTGPSGSNGSYTYIDGGQVFTPDWSSFFDHSQDNPWSYPDNRPTP